MPVRVETPAIRATYRDRLTGATVTVDVTDRAFALGVYALRALATEATAVDALLTEAEQVAALDALREAVSVKLGVVVGLDEFPADVQVLDAVARYLAVPAVRALDRRTFLTALARRAGEEGSALVTARVLPLPTA